VNGEAVLEQLLRRVDEAVYKAANGQPAYVSQGGLKRPLATAGEFQVSPAAIREETAWAHAHAGRVRRANEGGEDNGFILWNFLVGDARLRRTHQAELATISREWRDILRNRADVRVKIIGSASPSGAVADNQALSLRRAQSVRDFMTRHGVDPSRLDVEGVGISQPLSDNRFAEDMARNRRVDAFLYVPTNIMRPTAAIRRTVLNWVPTFSSMAILEIDLQNRTFAERLGAVRVTAQVRLSGTPLGSIVGFLQFLTQDGRLGIYRSRDGSRTVTLDYRRCVAPFLPARDVLDGASPLSVVRLGASSGPTTDVVEIGFADSPDVGFPLVHTVPGGETLLLAQTIWSMQIECSFPSSTLSGRLVLVAP
jgi:outer membrane protein OmpA-like peptidoglycan-associated protein